MNHLKSLQLALLSGLPALFFAQVETKSKHVTPTSAATDCPTWDGKKTDNRSDYLEYLRKSQGKKVNTTDERYNQYSANTKTSNADKTVNDSVEKPKSENDFYTQKRYNIAPSSDKPVKKKNVVRNSVAAPGVSIDENTKLKDVAKVESKQVIKAEIKPEFKKPAPTTTANSNSAGSQTTTPIIVEPTTADDKKAGDGNTKIESTKKEDSKFKKKMHRLFSKKNNKAAKPNYEKCTTKF